MRLIEGLNGSMGFRSWRIAAFLVPVCLSTFGGCPRSSTRLSLQGRAMLLSRQGRTDEANRLWLTLLNRARSGGDEKGVWEVQIQMARLAGYEGRVEVARALLMEVFQSAKTRKNRRSMAEARLELARIFYSVGRFQDALDECFWVPLYAEAGKELGLAALGHALAARISAVRGENEEALKMLARVRVMVRRAKGSTWEGSAHLETGQVLLDLADLNEASAHLERARMLFSLTGDLDGLYTVNQAIARIFSAKGRYGNAARVMEKAGSGFMSRRAFALAAAALHWAFNLHRAARDIAGQRRTIASAFRAYMQTPLLANQAWLSVDRASALVEGKKVANVVPFLREAAERLERLKDRFTAGHARLLLGRAHLLGGNTALAAEEVTRALDHAARKASSELNWRSYFFLGHLYDTVLDREERATRFYLGAANALQSLATGPDLLAIGDDSDADTVYLRLAEIHAKQYRRSRSDIHLNGVLSALERRTTRSLLTVLSRCDAALADSEKARRRYTALAGEEREVGRMFTDPRVSPAARKILWNRLVTLRGLKSKAENEAIRFSSVKMEPVTLTMIQRKLRSDEAFLAYLLSRTGGLMMVVRKDKAALHPIKAHKLDEICTDHVALLSLDPARRSEGERARLVSIEKKLAASLLDGAASHLAGAGKIFAVLPEPLGRCAIPALPWGRGRLGHNIRMVMIPSPATWLKLGATTPDNSSSRALVVIPQGPLASSPAQSALLAAGQKVRFLQYAFLDRQIITDRLGADKVAVWTGGMATEDRLKKTKLDQYRWIHFASHSLIPSRPRGLAQPALVLSAARRGSQDGLLLLREIVGMDFPAGGVLLSGGPASAFRNSDVMSGFLGSFLLSGARSVVFPLWAGSDESRRRYNAAFYKALAGDLPLDHAAEYAADSLRKHPAFTDPHYWASWVIYGVP